MTSRQTLKVQVLQRDPAQQQRIILGFACSVIGALCLSGCSTGADHVPLAPAPPLQMQYGAGGGYGLSSHDYLEQQEYNDRAAYQTVKVQAPVRDYASAGVKAETAKSKGCRPQDRFDRKHLVTYQWGEKDRSAIGLDVDGIGMDSMTVEAVKLEYRFRLQPIKKKVERCRYKSAWQGMVATSYYELFVREEDTIWRDLKKLQDDVGNRFDTLLGQ